MNLTEPKKEKFPLLLDFSNWKQAGIELNAFMLKHWRITTATATATQQNNNNNNKS